MEQKQQAYVFPEEVKEHELPDDKRQQYEVTEAQLQETMAARPNGEQIVPGDGYPIAYQCGNPPVTKYGRCTKYYGQMTGKYYYTLCDTQYDVCSRP